MGPDSETRRTLAGLRRALIKAGYSSSPPTLAWSESEQDWLLLLAGRTSSLSARADDEGLLFLHVDRELLGSQFLHFVHETHDIAQAVAWTQRWLV